MRNMVRPQRLRKIFFGGRRQLIGHNQTQSSYFWMSKNPHLCIYRARRMRYFCLIFLEQVIKPIVNKMEISSDAAAPLVFM